MNPYGHWTPPGGYQAGGYQAGAYSPLVHLLFIGLANLFWIVLLGTLLWTALAPRRQNHGRVLSSSDEGLSSLEMLRRSYILGQIDVETFAEMLVPVLESEEFARYHRLSPPTAL